MHHGVSLSWEQSSWVAEEDVTVSAGLEGRFLLEVSLEHMAKSKISLSGRDPRGRDLGISSQWTEAPVCLSSEGTLVIFGADGPLGLL